MWNRMVFDVLAALSKKVFVFFSDRTDWKHSLKFRSFREAAQKGAEN